MIPQIWAEISGNHGGSLENCLRLIDEAKKLGVDIIKFQRFTPEWLAQKRQFNPAILDAIGNPEQPYPHLVKLYKEINTPLHWWAQILERLDGYPFSCSVFSEEDVLFMVHVCKVKSLKLASFELTDLPLIRAIAKTHKPIVMSVNHAATQNDILRAYEAAQGCFKITFLHATRYYSGDTFTATEANAERRRFEWLLENVPPPTAIGLSDHSPGGYSPLACECTALGAEMIERHIALPDVRTPDSEFSSTPKQFFHYIRHVRMIGGEDADRRVRA